MLMSAWQCYHGIRLIISVDEIISWCPWKIVHKQWLAYRWFLGLSASCNLGSISDLIRCRSCGEDSLILENNIFLLIFVVSEAPVEAPKTQKYEKFQTYQQNYKTDEQKKEEVCVCVVWIFEYQISFPIGGSLIWPRITIILEESWLKDRPTFASNFIFRLHIWWAVHCPGAVRKGSWRINVVTW